MRDFRHSKAVLSHQGMYYLEENKVVHRNLAARNVLLKNNYIAQVSDYGIADLVHRDDKKYFFNEAKVCKTYQYYMRKSYISVKDEAIITFSVYLSRHQLNGWHWRAYCFINIRIRVMFGATVCWKRTLDLIVLSVFKNVSVCLGVTVWEMMSYGAEPYNTMRPQDISDLLEKGERLSQPQICTIDVYMVMVKCECSGLLMNTLTLLANEFSQHTVTAIRLKINLFFSNVTSDTHSLISSCTI